MSRLKEQSITAISDLSLIAQKLPEKERSEIFSYGRLKGLIESILNVNSDEHSDVNKVRLDPRRTYLAAMLVQEGIELCTKAYIEQNRETPVLTEANVDQLTQTTKKCNEIAYVMDLPTRKESKDDLQYLFNWSRVPGPDETKFVDFIESTFGSIYENFKDDNFSTYEITKNEPAAYRYENLEELQGKINAKGKKLVAIKAGHRTSEIVLNVIDMNHEIMATYSLILRYSTKAIKLIYEVHGKKCHLDPTNIDVKQDYGNFYIYTRKSTR